MDSIYLERWDSMYSWHSSMRFCDPRLCQEWATWSADRSRKDSSDQIEVSVYCSTHWGLRNAVFMTRLEHVLMDKSDCGNFRPGESLARYLCIWRCQNRYEGANDWGNTVERYLDGFYGLGTMRLHGLLSFQLDFQLQIPVLTASQLEILRRITR